MRKTALRKDLFREIRHTLGRFMSILLIIAVGVGFFSGFKATGPSMKYSAETYYSQNHLFDIGILTTIGFGDKDVEAIKRIDGIDRVVAGYSVDGLFSDSDGRENVVKVLSLPGENDDKINEPLITEGRMPEKEDECLFTISKNYLDNYNDSFKVGDKITIKDRAGKTDMDNILSVKTYTITGLASLPQYTSYSMGTSSVGSGTVNAAMMVSKSNFKYSRYTEIYITLKCHEQGISAFDNAYNEEVVRVTKELEKVGLTQFAAFIDESQSQIKQAEAQLKAGEEEANQQLSEAQAKLDDAQRQIAEGEQELLEGEDTYYQLSTEAASRLSAARSELDNNWQTYNVSKATYDASVVEYQQSEAEYNQSYANYEQELAEYEAKKSEMTTLEKWYKETQLGVTKAILDNSKSKLDSAKAQLVDAEAQLSSARQQLDAGEAEYAAAYAQAERELSEGRRELDDGYDELDSAKAEYYYGLAEYNEAVQKAKAELDNGQNQIQNANHSLSEVRDGKWYVLDRDDAIYNYSNFVADANRMDNMAKLFPIFFLLVAVLVCMTTMTRMVDEQRMQIGTYKALGYKSREIISKYVFYSGFAGILGCIIGPALFVWTVPKAIYSAYADLYFLPFFNIQVPWTMLCISVVIAMLCSIIPSVFECGMALRRKPAELMRPKAPKVGKRVFLEKISFIWNHMSFFRKLTVRNISRYKKRVLMSVIGIAGGMALMLAGFSLLDSVTPIVDIQFKDIDHYDVMFYFNDTRTVSSASPVLTALNIDKQIDDTLLINRNELKAMNIDSSISVDYTYMIAPSEPKRLREFTTLYDYKTGREISLDDEGAIITNKLAKMLNVSPGDEMIIQLGGDQYTIKVAGIAKNHLFHYVFMSPKYYQKVTKKELNYNLIYGTASDQLIDKEKFRETWLKNSDNFSLVYFISDSEEMLNTILSSLRLVVLVLIVSAGLLTFIVLYCLTNINIAERTREIATVKVLGFNKKEVNSYVFRENIIITLIALVVGGVLGYFLGQRMINTVEVSMHAFCHDVNILSFVYSAGLTIIFTLLVNWVMSKKIPKISMVESLKAVE